MPGMTEVARATVTIVPNMKGAQATISKQLGAVSADAGKMAGAKMGTAMSATLGGKLKGVGSGLTSIGKSLTMVSAGAVIAGKKFMQMAQVQDAAETKLTEVYKTRMGATDAAAESTMKLASAIQQQGVVGDEVTLSGAQQLATYAKMPKTVDSLLPAMDNLLVQQKGVNATAQDATQIANLFGKAMMGQTGALKRVGISFSDAQAEILKTGTEEQKAAMLAQVVTQNVGNMNAEFAKTDAGKIQQAKNSLGDMGERIGATLAPAVADLANWMTTKILPAIDKVITFAENNPIVAKIGLVVAAAGPLIMVLGKVISGVGSIISILPMIASPAGIAVAAVGGLIAVGVSLYKHWDQVKAFAAKAWGAIKNAITKPIEGAKNLLGKAVDGIKALFSPSRWLSIGSDLVSGIWNGISNAAGWLKDKLMGWVGNVTDFLKNLFGIGSPSKVMADEVGQWLPKGIAVGITDHEDVIDSAMQQIATDVESTKLSANMTMNNDPLGQANSVVSGVSMALAGASGDGNITIPIYLYPSGPKMGEQIVKAYDTYKRQLG